MAAEGSGQTTAHTQSCQESSRRGRHCSQAGEKPEGDLGGRDVHTEVSESAPPARKHSSLYLGLPLTHTTSLLQASAQLASPAYITALATAFLSSHFPDLN